MKILVILLLFFLSIDHIYAESNLPTCSATLPQDKWDHCQGEYSDGTTKYIGEFIRGKRSGFGIETIEGYGYYKYIGQWRDDYYHGIGTAIWGDGRKYVGDWKFGYQSGHGIFTTKYGDIEEGEWDNHGLRRGTIRYSNKDVFDGEMDYNIPDGSGTLKFSNGNVYSGSFKLVPEGQGTLFLNTGEKISGVWIKGKLGNFLISYSLDSNLFFIDKF